MEILAKLKGKGDSNQLVVSKYSTDKKSSIRHNSLLKDDSQMAEFVDFTQVKNSSNNILNNNDLVKQITS